MKSIITWEAICEKLEMDPNRLPDVTGFDPVLAAQVLGAYKMLFVPLALNPKDWKADWSDYNQKKFGVWYWIEESGFRLGVVGYGYVLTNTTSGARPLYATREIAEHADRYFGDWCAQANGYEKVNR